MKKTLAVRRDVETFYKEMQKLNKADIIYKDVIDLREGIQNLNKFDQSMVLERIPDDEKLAFLKDITKSLTPEWSNFFLETAYAYHFNYLADAINFYIAAYEKELLIIESVVPLSNEQIERIKASFEKKLQHSFPHVKHQLVPDLIGGVVVRTKNYVLDGSLRKQFTQIERQLHVK